MRKFLSQLMIPIQLLLMLVGVIFSFIQRIPNLWMRHVYYGWVQLKRRVAGEALWQEHDALVGFYPPKGHPFWRQFPSIGDREISTVIDDDPPRAA